ncbi:unnamed protein product [Rotaria magnacalcarata]|uniref:F-box domain-containing protein n=1 Tax=Rotaria magnacalcarata TaxID=392030 RepID=A0A816S0H7_9BILA|nr:unnamed protein product [Rotaria magnacalcarata]CAF4579713.1 unnamed protein product [Rotaria magnacalcarata]
MDIMELLDLPDELLLAIMKKINPQGLFLFSIINIGNYCLEQFTFNRSHSIGLTFDYFRALHKLLMKIFYSDAMPRIVHDIKPL